MQKSKLSSMSGQNDSRWPNASAKTAPDQAAPAKAARYTLGNGSKLLCLNDRNLRRDYKPEPIVRGRLYCVRELYVDRGEAGVLLVGIKGPVGADGLEQGFFLKRFRVVRL